MNNRAWNFKDRTGEKHGMLTVLRFAGKNKYRNATWECLCDCGKKTILCGGSIGVTQSCGCLRLVMVSKAKTIHGMCNTRTYKTWESMLKRCRSKNDPSFLRYGAVGITVCQEWLSFSRFLSDMGERPIGATIDRIENSKGYHKGNCRWLSLSGQCRNRTSNRILTINGVSKCLVEWSEESGIDQDTIGARLKRGWSEEKSVFAPLHTRGDRK